MISADPIPGTHRLTYCLTGAGLQPAECPELTTWFITFPMEEDAFAVRFWVGNMLPTPYRIIAAAFSASDSTNDYVNPTNGAGWRAVTFNADGADWADVDPPGGTRDMVVPIASSGLASGAGYEAYFSDWVSFTPVPPRQGTVRIGMLRVAMPAQAYSQIAGWRHPEWLNTGTPQARWRRDEPERWTANANVNHGRDYAILAMERADHATAPAAVAISTVRALGHGPVVGVQYLSRSRGVVIASSGDSIASGTGTSGAVNDFVTQACAALSTPNRPVVPFKATWGGRAHDSYLYQCQQALAQRPSVLHLQGFSRNGWNGTYQAWATQFANILLVAEEALAIGCRVIISTGVPSGLNPLEVAAYNYRIYPELTKAGFGPFGLLDTASLVCEVDAGLFTGQFLPGLSTDGEHPNDRGHGVLSDAFQVAIRGFAVPGDNRVSLPSNCPTDAVAATATTKPEPHLSEPVHLVSAGKKVTKPLRQLLPFKAVMQDLKPTGDGEESLTLSYSRFKEIIRTFLYYAPFDEAWYLKTHPEIAAAIRAGSVSSCHAHFLWHGYFEGRSPHERYFPEGSPSNFFHVPESYFQILIGAASLADQRHRIAACEAYHNALVEYPDSVHARLELGRLLFQLRRFGESEKILLPLMRPDEKNPAASRLLAEISGHFRQMELRFEFLNAASSTDPRADMVERAMIAYELGQLVICERICKRFQVNSFPDIMKFSAETLEKIRKERAALASLIRSRQGSTPNKANYVEISYHLSRLGWLRLASKLIVPLLSTESGIFEVSDSILIKLAEAIRLVNGREAAISFATDAMLARDTGTLRLYLGRSLYEADRPTEAAQIVSGIAGALHTHESAELLAMIHLRCGEFDQALSICQTGLGLWHFSYWPAEKILTALFETQILRLAEPGRPHRIAIDAIPARLIQFWDKTTPPPDVQAAIDSWRSFNPNFEHTVFSDAGARDYLRRKYGSEIVELFDYCYHPAMRSDFFRVAFLALEGGIYVDADEVCSGSISDFLATYPASEVYLITSSRKDIYLFNGFIACLPAHKLVMLAFDQIVSALRDAKKASYRPNIWETTGPGQISRAVAYTVLSDSAAAASICLIAESDYQDISKTEWMEYKGTAEGNWRV